MDIDYQVGEKCGISGTCVTRSGGRHYREPGGSAESKWSRRSVEDVGSDGQGQKSRAWTDKVHIKDLMP